MNLGRSRREAALIREARKQAVRDYESNTYVQIQWQGRWLVYTSIAHCKAVQACSGLDCQPHTLLFDLDWKPL
jgi:hypothetical protein